MTCGSQRREVALCLRVASRSQRVGAAPSQAHLPRARRKAPDARSPRRCWETQGSAVPATLGPRAPPGAPSARGSGVGRGRPEGNSLLPAVSRLQNRTNGTTWEARRELSLEPARPPPLSSARPGGRASAGPRRTAPALESGRPFPCLPEPDHRSPAGVPLEYKAGSLTAGRRVRRRTGPPDHVGNTHERKKKANTSADPLPTGTSTGALAPFLINFFYTLTQELG